VNVAGTYSSITDPSGKSNPYAFTNGDSINGGSSWTWTVNGIDSDTQINTIIVEG
jgi:hypothetical protein